MIFSVQQRVPVGLCWVELCLTQPTIFHKPKRIGWTLANFPAGNKIRQQYILQGEFDDKLSLFK